MIMELTHIVDTGRGSMKGDRAVRSSRGVRVGVRAGVRVGVGAVRSSGHTREGGRDVRVVMSSMDEMSL